MSKLTKKRSKKAGLPPGTLVHIGEKRREEVKISVITYNETSFEEKETDSIEECLPSKDKPAVTWINMEGVHEVTLLEKLCNSYGIHPLVQEDILNTDQRPKLEDFGDYIYIVLKMLYSNHMNKGIVSEQISLILGKNFVISFQEGLEGDLFDNVRELLRIGKGRMRRMGADYLAYALMDSIVDHYFVIFENLGERIEFIEEELVKNPTDQTLHSIHAMKRELIFLRKLAWPLREVVNKLERGESALIQDSTQLYFRDVYDHIIQIVDTIETFRDMVSGMLDIYLSNVSYRINAVMKVLTIIATIFMPLTFLAGVYGMNFKYMPELEWKWGYPVVWILMAAIALSMILYFRKKRWL